MVENYRQYGDEYAQKATKEVMEYEETLKNWEDSKREYPELYTDDYKKTIKSLLNYESKALRSPIDAILNTGLSFEKIKERDDPNILGVTGRSRNKIHLFPHRIARKDTRSVAASYIHEMSHQIFPSTTQY